MKTGWMMAAAIFLAALSGGKVMGAEAERTIIFYGDSNTYGFDPADMEEGRYPEEHLWTTLLQEKTGSSWNIIPQGLNGRKIPDPTQSADWILPLLEQAGEDGMFAVMLGTNDILSMYDPDAEVVQDRMDIFLTFLTDHLRPDQILVIAPVPSGSETSEDPLAQKYYKECLRMNRKFRESAEEYQVHFADAGEWGVELCFDLVHISEEGQKTFAEQMAAVLEELQE